MSEGNAGSPVLWDGPVWPPEEHPVVRAVFGAIGSGEPFDRQALQRALEARGVVWPLRLNAEPPPVIDEAPHNDVFTRIALDIAPAAGEDGPRVVMAGWHSVLDLADPVHLRAWAGAVAAHAFVASGSKDRAPVRSWLQDGRRIVRPGRDGIAAAARTPPVPWRLHAQGERFAVEPLLPVHPAWVPSEAVDLSGVGGVDGGPVDGGMLLARLVPGPVGAVPVAGLALPQVPDAARLEAWFAHCALPQVVVNPDLLVEDVLRRGGHGIYRQAHAWWWRASA